MQFTPEDTRCSLCPQRILRKDRRTRKTKLIVTLKLALEILLSLAKLRTVALVKDENNLLIIDRQLPFTPHQIIQLLNSRDNNLIIIKLNITL